MSGLMHEQQVAFKVTLSFTCVRALGAVELGRYPTLVFHVSVQTGGMPVGVGAVCTLVRG